MKNYLNSKIIPSKKIKIEKEFLIDIFPLSIKALLKIKENYSDINSDVEKLRKLVEFCLTWGTKLSKEDINYFLDYDMFTSTKLYKEILEFTNDYQNQKENERKKAFAKITEIIKGEDSEIYDEELTFYANKINLMFKTNSINFEAVSLRDLIWLETAFYVNSEIQAKLKCEELAINVDIRALLKDLDDVQRISKSGKQNAALKWSDLPSQQKNKDNQINEKDDTEARKDFLRKFKINRNKQEF